MKRVLIVLVVAALMAVTTATALASHGAKLPAAPLPAHGSIWFGRGVEHQESLQTGLMLPVHGSVWFGEGVNALMR